MDTKTFGERLVELIQRSGYRSQRQFAQAIDMDPTYLSRIVKGGVARPERETLERMAEGLRVPFDTLAVLAGARPVAERLEISWIQGKIGHGPKEALQAEIEGRIRELTPHGTAAGEQVADLGALRDTLPEYPGEEQNRLLRAVIARVVVTGRRLRVEWRPEVAVVLREAGHDVPAVALVG